MGASHASVFQSAGSSESRTFRCKASPKDQTPLTMQCMTWNLHGKSIDHVSTLFHSLEVPPQIMFLQEVGDVKDVALGGHDERLCEVAGVEFVGYVANPTLSHRCMAVLVACEFDFLLQGIQVHDAGLSVHGCMFKNSWMLTSWHLPHAHRSDSVEVWRTTLSQTQDFLGSAPPGCQVLIGHDLNQDAHADVDEFDGMMHYRQFVHRAGLDLSAPLGATWVARGTDSAIDFLLFRIRGAEMCFWKRDDLRIALPSDHCAVGATVQFREVSRMKRRKLRQTLCGKWHIDAEQFFAALQDVPVWDQRVIAAAARRPGVSTRLPTLRYRDPPDIKDLIDRRKATRDPDARAAFMQEIHQTRREARQEHKTSLLQRAKGGDWRAIAHLRRSAAGSFTEGSYIQRAGGLEKATRDLHDFYAQKYASADPPISEAQMRDAHTRHDVHVVPVTHQELTEVLSKCRSGVSAGLDGVPFEGLKALLSRDEDNRLGQYFTRLLRGEAEVPQSWCVGKIVLLPKVSRPSEPGELRPICLVPTLSRLYAKVLMERLRSYAPEYQAHQLACRPGVQVLDGIVAAQTVMALVKKTTGQTCKVAKLDIKAAFDSVSHHAVYRWLMACAPCAEALRLMSLCFGTSVNVSLGGLNAPCPCRGG